MAYGRDPLKKHFETRSWPTKYRGKLLIHAAKAFPAEAAALTKQPGPIRDALHLIMSTMDATALVGSSPGHVIGIGILVDCIRVPELYPVQLLDGRTIPPAEPELSFGNYAPGRFAWITQDMRPLPKPIPWRGSQGLFEVPDDVVAAA